MLIAEAEVTFKKLASALVFGVGSAGLAMILMTVILVSVIFLGATGLFFLGNDDNCPWEGPDGKEYGGYSVDREAFPPVMKCVYSDGRAYNIRMLSRSGWSDG